MDGDQSTQSGYLDARNGTNGHKVPLFDINNSLKTKQKQLGQAVSNFSQGVAQNIESLGITEE